MTLCALLILPCSMFIISKVMKRSQKYFRQQQKYLGDVNGQVEEVYAGQNIVKAFNKEDAVMATFEETNKKLYESGWKSQFFSGICLRNVIPFAWYCGFSLSVCSCIQPYWFCLCTWQKLHA